MKLKQIIESRLVPVSIHATGELPEGIEEAAEEFKPSNQDAALYRIADTQCYVWALDGLHLSPILVEEKQAVVAIL